MEWITIVGLIAAVLTTSAQLPQAVRAFRTKKTGDISLMMFIILSIGVFMWLIYGILIWDIPLITANIVSFALAVMILSMKIRYDGLIL